MSEEDKHRLQERHRRAQKHLVSYEEQQRRKAVRRARGPQIERAEDDDPEATFARMRRQPRTPTPSRDKPAAFEPNLAEFHATVVWLGRGRARVLAADGEHEVVLAPDLAADQRAAIAVGDEVLVHERDGALPRIAAVLPRRSVLARSDGEHEARHLLAANVDRIVLVLVADRPRLGLIDRLRIALDGSGAELLVCVNKCGLPHDAHELQRVLAPYVQQGLTFHRVSAAHGHGLDELRAAIAGLTTAFVGHSGVGKSTLLNALDPQVSRATSGVRERDGRGRHTTSASSLTRLADGTQLIDTPGVRLFGLCEGQDDALAAFPEIAELGARCRFRDCQHRTEPGCAVRQAVELGELAAERLTAFQRLFEPPH